MIMLNIFRSIAVIALLTTINTAAQPDAIDPHSDIIADTIKAKQQPDSVSKDSITAAGSTKDSLNETLSVPVVPIVNAAFDSGASEERISAPVSVEPIQKQSENKPIDDTLVNRLFTDFGMSTLNLSLNEAIDHLLQYNPLVIAAKLEWKSNERKALAALGPFEPSITGGFNYNYTGYNYRPYPERNLDQSIGLKGRMISGGEYSFNYKITDMRNNRSSLDLPQAYTGGTITQPLLRNAWYGSEQADRKVAVIDRETAYHTYRSKLIEMIAELQSAYWNLAFSQERYRFALQSVKIAEEVVTDAKLRLKTGKMSMGELIEAEAGLSTRQANLADAGQELLDAANQLKLLLSTDDISKDRLLFCTEKIFVSDSGRVAGTLSDSSAGFNITNHPEYRIRKLELDKETVISKYRTGQCLPVLNAKGSLGISGYGSKASKAMNRLLNDPQPAWAAMFELELPVLAGVESRNLLLAQKLKTEAAQKNLSAIEYQIVNTMRIITQRVAGHCEQARKAGSVVEYRQRLLDIEFQKLDAGKSTYRLTYETEEKLSEARQWQLESNVKYRMAMVQQAKITGSMLADFALETIDRGQVILTNKLTQRDRSLRTSGKDTR